MVSAACAYMRCLCSSIAILTSDIIIGATAYGMSLQEPASPSVTVPEVASGAASLVFCSWYYFSKHWLANNALGLAFSIQGIEHLSLGAISTGAL